MCAHTRTLDACASGSAPRPCTCGRGVRVGVHRRSAESVSKTVPPAGVSPEHLAGTFQTLRETRGLGRSHSGGLNRSHYTAGGRVYGWRARTSIHLLLARLSSLKPVVLHSVLTQLSANIWSQSGPRRFISGRTGETSEPVWKHHFDGNLDETPKPNLRIEHFQKEEETMEGK